MPFPLSESSPSKYTSAHLSSIISIHGHHILQLLRENSQYLIHGGDNSTRCTTFVYYIVAFVQFGRLGLERADPVVSVLNMRITNLRHPRPRPSSPTPEPEPDSPPPAPPPPPSSPSAQWDAKIKESMSTEIKKVKPPPSTHKHVRYTDTSCWLEPTIDRTLSTQMVQRLAPGHTKMMYKLVRCWQGIVWKVGILTNGMRVVMTRQSMEKAHMGRASVAATEHWEIVQWL